jgi:hypothetical protein
MMNMHRSIVHGIFPSLSSSSSSLATSVMIVLLTESTYSYACTQPISYLTHLPIYLSIRLDWIGMQTLYDREHSDGVFIYYGGGCSEDP